MERRPDNTRFVAATQELLVDATTTPVIGPPERATKSGPLLGFGGEGCTRGAGVPPAREGGNGSDAGSVRFEPPTYAGGEVTPDDAG